MRLARLTPTLALLLAACTFGGSPHRDRQLAELRYHRLRWEQQGIHDYQYVLRRGCFCAPDYSAPRLVTVRDDRYAAVVDSATGEPRFEGAVDNPTVDSIFAMTERAILDERQEVTVSYHDTLDYPTQVVGATPRMLDGGWSISATGLTPLTAAARRD